MRHPMGSTYTSVLLGEQSASKTDELGSTPGARACRRGSTEKGACLVNRFMLVRIQSSALFVPMVYRIALDPPKVQVLVQIQVGILIHAACECAGSHGSPRNCKTRFNSSAGC